MSSASTDRTASAPDAEPDAGPVEGADAEGPTADVPTSDDAVDDDAVAADDDVTVAADAVDDDAVDDDAVDDDAVAADAVDDDAVDDDAPDLDRAIADDTGVEGSTADGGILDDASVDDAGLDDAGLDDAGLDDAGLDDAGLDVTIAGEGDDAVVDIWSPIRTDGTTDGPDAASTDGFAAPDRDTVAPNGAALPPVATSSASSAATALLERPESRWDRPVWAVPGPGEPPDAVTSARGRRRRWPWVVAAAVVVGILVLAVVESLGRRYITGEVTDRLRESGITGDVEVSIGDGLQPVVLRALAGGGIDELSVRITDGTVGGLPVRRADYDLRGIDGDISVLRGSIRVHSIEDGAVRIEVSPRALEPIVGTSLRISDGKLVAGDPPLAVDVGVQDGSLVLGGAAEQLWGGPVAVPIVDDYVLPCAPDVRIGRSTIVLSCRGSELPGVLADPLGVDGGVPTAPAGDLVPPQSTVAGDGGATVTTPGAVPATTVPATTVPATTVPVDPATVATTVPPSVAPPAVPGG